MARRTGGKGTSAGSGLRSGTGRYGRKYNLEKDDDGGSYVDTSHPVIHEDKIRTVSREKYNTASYEKMRDRKEILRDLYAPYRNGGVGSSYLSIQLLLDIREILSEIRNKI